MMLIFALAAAAAVSPGPFEQYQVESETVCVGAADRALAAPDTWTTDGFKFNVKGGTAEVHAEVKARGDEARIGLLAAVKDFSPETQANLATFLAAFRKAGVTAVVVDGDSAYGVDDQDTTLTDLFSFLGGQGLPIYGIIGNSESRSSFNRALLTAYRKHPTVLNLDLVRRVDGDGFTLVSLPGYYDKRYIHESAGCQYKPEDVQGLAQVAKGAKAPVVLISHGPPRQEGRAAIDVTEDGHNVGDPELAVVIAEARIPFGVFGHILESGGRATDLTGTRQVKPGQAVPALYINPGPAFADPWNLNSGAISHGMAAILTIKNGKGEWQQVKASASASAGRPKGRTSRPRAR